MKIGTWNLQGNAYNMTCSSFAEAKVRMIQNDLDVLCLQETGVIATQGTMVLNDPNFTKITNLNIGTQHRSFYVNCYKYLYGHANYRCSMAILVKSNLDLNAPAIIPTIARPVFGVLLNNNIAVYNIHAPANGGIFTMNYDKNAVSEVRNIVNRYGLQDAILVGDYNTSPDNLAFAFANDPIVNANIFAPQNSYGYEPTHNSGNCLDYCCCINNIYPPEISVNDNWAYSDHRSVIFNFL